MFRSPPRSKLTDPLFPYPTLFRSARLGSQPRRSACRLCGCSGTVPEGGRLLTCRISRPTLRLRKRHPDRMSVGGALPVTIGQTFDVLAREDVGADKTYTRSEEHTSELQSLMRISYAVFCLTK